MTHIVQNYNIFFVWKLFNKSILAHLELVSANFPGAVKIRGIATDLYVTMNENGIVYGQVGFLCFCVVCIFLIIYFKCSSEVESAIFKERFQGSYNTYLSEKYTDNEWYIGIKKSGEIKQGPKTKYGQKAIQFLPNRKLFE